PQAGRRRRPTLLEVPRLPDMGLAFVVLADENGVLGHQLVAGDEPGGGGEELVGAVLVRERDGHQDFLGCVVRHEATVPAVLWCGFHRAKNDAKPPASRVQATPFKLLAMTRTANATESRHEQGVHR